VQQLLSLNVNAYQVTRVDGFFSGRHSRSGTRNNQSVRGKLPDAADERKAALRQRWLA
jgi:hypothetical protein